MGVAFVDLRRQYQEIGLEIRSAIDRVIQSCAFIMGPDVKEFEREFAEYCGVPYCIGVASGTSAMELALRALGIGAGDEVIIPANTYIASALAVSAVGAVPVLVDMDPVTANIDCALIEAAITPRTKVLLPVHLYGRPADMDALREIAERHALLIVEDAAQAHGARYRGGRAGSFGDAACFSFYPGKNLGAYGDGGAVVTKDPKIWESILLQRDFGQRRKYDHVVKGTNSRLDTLQAAVLRVKLRHLDRWNARRLAAARLYNELLEGLPEVVVPDVSGPAESVFHLYVVEVPVRAEIMQTLQGAGVQFGIHYPIPIHRQLAYSEMRDLSFPVTERRCERILSLPMFGEITDEEVRYVSRVLSSAVPRSPVISLAT